MHYTPAFTEIFVAWVAVVGWSAWLRPRAPEGAGDTVLAVLPWLTGATVMIGQAVAVVGLMGQTPSGGTAVGPSLIRVASFASAGVVVLALLVELGSSLGFFVAFSTWKIHERHEPETVAVADDGTWYQFLHLDMQNLAVVEGQSVAPGQRIGKFSNVFFDSNGNATPTTMKASPNRSQVSRLRISLWT